jgi:hypothetical protein
MSFDVVLNDESMTRTFTDPCEMTGDDIIDLLVDRASKEDYFSDAQFTFHHFSSAPQE